MDGRRETVYSDAMISAHLRFYAASEDGIAFAHALGADYAWLPVQSAAAAALAQRGWTRVFEGEQSAILVSPQKAGDGPFVQPAPGRAAATRRFPDP
jgi:hypothetical protein